MPALSLDDYAMFSWAWGQEFFLETEEGNFIWSDPDYGGDNTITRYRGTIRDYCREAGIPCLRDKGQHQIRAYCGENAVISPEGAP